MIKKPLLTLMLAATSLMTSKAETLFPCDENLYSTIPGENLYSTIIGLSKLTHGWLYDYANTKDSDDPRTELIGLPIWAERPKVFKLWEPGDDKTN
jgi:hypothetical protein